LSDLPLVLPLLVVRKIVHELSMVGDYTVVSVVYAFPVIGLCGSYGAQRPPRAVIVSRNEVGSARPRR